jgi:glycosyltransferase involved in cell wall biosynthesis
MFSNYRNLNADSCYIVIKKVVEAIIEKDPSWKFLIAFPKEGFDYVDDGFFHHKQVKRIPIELPKRKMDSVIHFNVMYWRKVFNAYTPDILWNHVPEQGHLFLNFYTGFDVDMSKLNIVNQHHYVIHPSLPYPIDTYRAVQFQSMGSYLVALNIFNSKYCRKMFYDVTREVIRDEVKFPEKVVPFRFIPKDYPQPNVPAKTEQVKIIYNHRLQDYKNYLTTFEMFAQLWTTHKNFKVVVTNPNGANFSKLTQYPFVEGLSIANHDAYLKELATCHLNVTNTVHETFCISALESLAMGQIVVAPNAITFPEITPPEYEWLFNNEEHQYRLLDKLLTNPSIFDEQRDKIKNWTRDYYASEKIADDYISTFNELVELEWTTDNFKPDTLEKFKRILKGKRGFVTLTDIQKELGQANLGKQAFPLMKIKRCLNKMGYIDEIRGIEQGILVQ